jgi:inositol phosphorylceramide mannosyltransferase catalytic subunit
MAAVPRPEIPKRIIQTAKSRTLSIKDRAFTSNVRLLNPCFDWRFFDDADVTHFIANETARYRAAFDAFRYPIQRFDFFRYLAVYRLGGFYFDLDVLLAQELSPLLKCSCVFPFEGLTFSDWLRAQGMDWEIGNYAFGASAGHPFLEAVIENCIRAQTDRSWVAEMMRGAPALLRSEYYVLYTTGPGLISRTLAEQRELASDVKVLFPNDVCDAESWNKFGDYGIHLMDGTWRPKSSYLRKRLAQRYEAWALKRIVRRSRLRGATRAIVSER